MPKVSNRERRMKIKHFQRQLRMIELERKFEWKTPKYQEAHISLLNSQQEKITRKLEEIL